MASVTSLTATRIQELLSDWEDLGLNQDEINALVVQLRSTVGDVAMSQAYFDEVTRPHLQADLAAGLEQVANLTDNVLPELHSNLEAAALDVQNLSEVELPSLRTDLDNTIVNVAVSPHVYVQDTAPTNPDVDDRDLVVGDVWYNSSDNNRQKIWNGVEWSTFAIDVADFSLTARSFISTRHQLY